MRVWFRQRFRLPPIALATLPTIWSCVSDWTSPPVRSPVAELLQDLDAALGTLGVRWYLFGAQAAILYGVARLTADVDVTVQVPAGQSVLTWMPTLKQHRFQPRFADAAFLAQTRVLPLVHQPTALPVDLVLAGPGLEEEFLARAHHLAVDDVLVPVVDVTDLVILKVLAARAKDLEDVATLLRIQAERIDESRVRHVLSLLEAALGQSDLLPAFERLLTAATRRG
jgi:hypothetical protein